MMSAGSIEATRELCTNLDHLIEFAGESRVPIRALTLIERARADLQAYLDEMERIEVPTWLRLKAKGK
jgi:hypothetical protein